LGKAVGLVVLSFLHEKRNSTQHKTDKSFFTAKILDKVIVKTLLHKIIKKQKKHPNDVSL